MRSLSREFWHRSRWWFWCAHRPRFLPSCFCVGRARVTSAGGRANRTMALCGWARSIAALLLAIAVSRPAAAQAPASPTSAVSMAASASGNSLAPTLAATRLGFSLDEAQPRPVNASAARMGKREGRALALVGGIAVIAGLVINDDLDAGDVIALGGAGLGLYGLFVWWR
jgi:hypothetical protein